MEIQEDAQQDTVSEELEMEPIMDQPVTEKLEYEIEDRGRSQTVALNRTVKLMSELIKNQTTPKNIRGVEIDENQKLKYSNKKNKILKLEIEIDVP